MEASLVSCAVPRATTHPSASEPIGESLRIVVAAAGLSASIERLRDRHPAELATPDHQRRIQESAPGEILEQGGNRLVDLRAVKFEILLNAVVGAKKGTQLFSENGTGTVASMYVRAYTLLLAIFVLAPVPKSCGSKCLADRDSAPQVSATTCSIAGLPGSRCSSTRGIMKHSRKCWWRPCGMNRFRFLPTA